MHYSGPGLLQRPLNVDLSKISGLECYYLSSKSCDCYEQKQTPRDSCSIAVSRHSEDKIGLIQRVKNTLPFEVIKFRYEN